MLRIPPGTDRRRLAWSVAGGVVAALAIRRKVT